MKNYLFTISTIINMVILPLCELLFTNRHIKIIPKTACARQDLAQDNLFMHLDKIKKESF
jgi:hypothetical protein